MMWSDELTEKLVSEMRKNYPAPECALNFENLFQLLIAVMLSAQTTDKQVNVVTPALFKDYPDAETLGKALPEEIESYIKRIGMYHTKARNIVAASRMLVEKFDGRVPDSLAELMELPGVGRKTANVVLAVGYGVPAIPVDTHVFRVANRLGIVCEKDVLKTELALMEKLPKETWIDMHHALIWHGRLVCKARRPECEVCTLSGICRHFNEE